MRSGGHSHRHLHLTPTSLFFSSLKKKREGVSSVKDHQSLTTAVCLVKGGQLSLWDNQNNLKVFQKAWSFK